MITSESTTFTLDNMGRFLCNTLQEAFDSAAQSVGVQAYSGNTVAWRHIRIKTP